MVRKGGTGQQGRDDGQADRADAAGAGERYLLCIPRGCGLNDTLVQIWQSYRVAKAQRRTLMIDTRLCAFWDHLDDYLVPVPGRGIVARTQDDDVERLNGFSCHPKRAEGRIDFLYREMQLRQEVARQPSRGRRMVRFAVGSVAEPARPPFDDRGGRRIRFLADRMKNLVAPPDYGSGSEVPERVLVHHRSGGGPESVLALRLFTFAEPVRDAVQQALRRCGDDYDAIHIRNTDLRTDLAAAVAAARPRVAGRRVLVCSDDRRAIESVRRRLPESDVFTVTDTEDTAGAPLHKVGAHRGPDRRRELNTAMLVDLICLARSRELIVPPLADGGTSGFGILAGLLHAEPRVVAQLLGEHE